MSYNFRTVSSLIVLYIHLYRLLGLKVAGEHCVGFGVP